MKRKKNFKKSVFLGRDQEGRNCLCVWVGAAVALYLGTPGEGWLFLAPTPNPAHAGLLSIVTKGPPRMPSMSSLQGPSGKRQRKALRRTGTEKLEAWARRTVES